MAIGVLLVAILSAFGSQVTSMNLVSSSREIDTAVMELQACMESILTMETDQIPLVGSAYEAEVPIAGYDALPGETIIPSYPGFPTGSSDPRQVPDPLQIILTLTWNDAKGHARSMTLTSVKTK